MKINIGEKNKGGKLMNDYNNFSESYSNPRVKKLRSFAQSTYGMEAASYKGIAMKTLYFRRRHGSIFLHSQLLRRRCAGFFH